MIIFHQTYLSSEATKFGEADALLHSWGALGVAGTPRFLEWGEKCDWTGRSWLLWTIRLPSDVFFRTVENGLFIDENIMIYCTQNRWLSIATSNRGYEFLCFFWCFLLVCKFRGLLWGTPIWWFLKLLFFRENNHLEVCPHFTTPRSCQTPKTPLGLLWRKRHHIARRDFHRDPIQWDPMGYHARI